MRDQTKYEFLKLRIPPEEAIILDRLAKETDRSKAGLVRWLLVRAGQTAFPDNNRREAARLSEVQS